MVGLDDDGNPILQIIRYVRDSHLWELRGAGGIQNEMITGSFGA